MIKYGYTLHFVERLQCYYWTDKSNKIFPCKVINDNFYMNTNYFDSEIKATHALEQTLFDKEKRDYNFKQALEDFCD